MALGSEESGIHHHVPNMHSGRRISIFFFKEMFQTKDQKDIQIPAKQARLAKAKLLCCDGD